MKLRALVVDDEPLARRRLRRLLAAHADVELVGECADGIEGAAAVLHLRPDVVFLDIQMPERDGFAMLEALPPAAAPAVVFVTAHDEHALRAFDVHAIDYLLKPVDRERFERALLRVRRAARAPAGLDARIRALLDERRGGPARLALKCEGRLVLVEVERIDWVEAEGNYVRVHSGRTAHFVRETLQALESRLAAHGFARVHRSTLVNLRRVKEVHPSLGGDQELVLADGTRLRLSRGQRARFDALLRSI